MTLKFFWKEDCPKCPSAKARVSDIENVQFYNLDEPDGLAEAAFYSVMSTPSVVISNDSGAEVVAFRGDVPENKVLQKWL